MIDDIFGFDGIAMKSPSKSDLKNICDRLFEAIIISRYGKCLDTGVKTDLTCMRVIPAQYMSVRWEYANGICLGADSARYFRNNPLEWEQFIMEHYGDSFLRKLKAKALADKNYGREYLEKLYAKLKADWEALSVRGRGDSLPAGRR
jgi:hypothetical protein